MIFPRRLAPTLSSELVTSPSSHPWPLTCPRFEESAPSGQINFSSPSGALLVLSNAMGRYSLKYHWGRKNILFSPLLKVWTWNEVNSRQLVQVSSNTWKWKCCIYPRLVAPDSAITPLSNIAAHEQTKNSKLWKKEKDQTRENLGPRPWTTGNKTSDQATLLELNSKWERKLPTLYFHLFYDIGYSPILRI